MSRRTRAPRRVSSKPKPIRGECRGVSLRYELATLLYAISAARIVSTAVAHHLIETDRDRHEAGEAIIAVHDLVALRLRALDAVLAKDADPRTILAPHNRVLHRHIRRNDDIVITIDDRPSTKQVMRKMRAERIQ